MPEGDTIHKLAVFLATALVGQRLAGARLRGQDIGELREQRVQAVASKGKHLLIEFDGGLSLRVHLGMYGSWHRYPVWQPWEKPARQATLELSIQELQYVCFNAKEVELVPTLGFRMRDQTSRLGPDLTCDTPAIDALLKRARGIPSTDTEVTDLLLDQRIASGIGNVYKSEVLFLERCAPRARVGDLNDDTLAALYRTAERLLKNNLGGGPRVTRTTDDGRGILWVYGRDRRPCLRCGVRVERAYLGRYLRPTYWCPSCQA